MSVSHKSAAVYRLKDNYFVHTLSRTTAGFWIASLPAELIPTALGADALGASVAKVLAASVDNVPTPRRDQYRAISAPLLKIAKVRSWLALQRSAALCNIWRTDAELVAEPTRNGGASGEGRGYHPLGDQGVSVRGEIGAKQIGEAVVAALERCR